MNKLFEKIRFWFWWKFKATDSDKILHQTVVYGSGIMNGDGKFVDVRKFYKLD